MKDKTNKHQNQHPDDMAVDRFAAAMKIKLAAAREKGRSGWDDPATCQVDHLAELLVSHVGKGNHGNFEDIANLAMMLHQRGADPSVLSDCIQQSGKSNWPDKCPITRRDFFMEIDGVPTYGGPYDSYTIPEMEGTPDQPWPESLTMIVDAEEAKLIEAHRSEKARVRTTMAKAQKYFQVMADAVFVEAPDGLFRIMAVMDPTKGGGIKDPEGVCLEPNDSEAAERAKPGQFDMSWEHFIELFEATPSMKILGTQVLTVK